MKKLNYYFNTILFLLVNIPFFAQDSVEPRSTKDLSFLIGDWKVTRLYSPNSDRERTMHGMLRCKESLDGQYIRCVYEMKRPGKIRGLDVVYFNYNSIYKYFESIWLSSTWPIKGIMKIELDKDKGNFTMKTSGQFLIENNLMEYVKGTLTIRINGMKSNRFTRNTYIRTSEFDEGIWHHHMVETAEKKP